MTDLQSIIDSVGDAARAERSNYHVTLGELIEELRQMEDKQKPVVFETGRSPAHPHSYRGYYQDLGLQPGEKRSVAEVLEIAEDALGSEFRGYKGGDFEMGENTPLWMAERGTTENSDAIIKITEDEDAVVLILGDVT